MVDMSDNPYQGINAHLNSIVLAPDTEDQPALWHSFRFSHNGHIANAISELLPDHYFLMIELSFHEYPTESPDEEIKQPKAIVLRELTPQGKIGCAVVRIEVLSPLGKPGGRDYQSYFENRKTMLAKRDIPLVEIDYIHESPPILPKIPIYRKDQFAYPYHIFITDPRPHINKVDVYSFGVNEPIPKISVPLLDNEHVMVDLNAVYQNTFKVGRWWMLFDYSVEPERFETYSPEDQAKIRAVMERINRGET